MSQDLFSPDNLNRFAAAWYYALDMHVPVPVISQYLSDDVQMIFPEKTLPGMSDFIAWYAGGPYSDGTDAPGVINIFFEENHNLVSVEAQSSDAGSADKIDVRVVVAWQASWYEKPATKAKRTSLDATQLWTLRPSDKNEFGIVITRYNAVAEPFQYAPGFARL